MRWIEVSVAAASGEIDNLCEQLELLGVGSMCIEDEADFKQFLENNHKFWDYVDDELNEKFAGVSRVKFYLADDADGAVMLDRVRQALPEQHIDTAFVEDADWENNWKDYYEPIPIGQRILVVPAWLNPELEGRVPLRLDPGLAFGTGSHATTRMCLEALEQFAAPGTKALDLGCGSGILGIGALLLGCDRVMGCDIDPKSPDSARMNAALNEIPEERYTVCAGDVLCDEGMRRYLGEGYNIVLANIVADVILPLSGFVRRFMAQDAVYICSGIIDYRAEEVEAELKKQGFTILQHLHSEEWHAFVAK